MGEAEKELEKLSETRNELQKEMSEAENEGFANFMKRHGFKNLQEYEKSHLSEDVKSFNEKKNSLIQEIQTGE